MAHQSHSDARSLYHRWRSRSFSEVVAQEHVTRTLKNAVAGGRIVHAYLFCGPRGTGKTSTARILAKAVNCLDPQQGEPCNRCSSCVAVHEGRAIDLIEIDAASNRGIDDARELREKIKYSPSESRYKVYIIDEAHMLTSEASNALLKTLEEPPDHAILILATTEAHKILPTISSRCQRFDFRRIPLQAIAEQLGMICEREGLTVETGVLERVARMARGSLRDAESLLDQLVAYCGDRIGLESAREVLGLTGEEAVPEFAEALRGGEVARGFRLIDAAASTGADLRHFSRELVDYLRALVVVRSGADTSLTREFRPEEMARLRAAAEGWRYQQLLAALRTFGDLEGRMRLEPFNQLHLEIAFMEVALTGETSGGGPSPREGSADGSGKAAAAGFARESAPREGDRPINRLAAPAPPAPVKAERTEEPVTAEPTRAAPQEKAIAESGAVFQEVTPEPSKVSPVLDLASVKREWPRIVEELNASGNQAIGVPLAGCEPLEVIGSTITLGFQRAGWRHTVERPGVRGKMEESLGNVFGTRVTVQFRYGVKSGGGPVSPERDAVVQAAVRELGFTVARIERKSD